MRSSPILVLVLLLQANILPALAQENNPLINSGKLIDAGISLYDSGEYKKALDIYKKIDRNDTNYIRAQYEMALTYYADSQYAKAIPILDAALRDGSDPEREPDLYNQYGNSIDAAGDPLASLPIYDSAIKKYPGTALLYMNKGVVLLELRRYKEAEEVIQQSLMINPYLYSAHYKLALVALHEGKIIPAFLGFIAYLLVFPEGKYHNNCISLLKAIANNQDDIQGYINNRKEGPSDNYQLLEQIIQSKIALDKNYKPIIRMDDVISRQIQVLFEKMQYDSADNDFWVQYYMPYFKSVFTKGQFELFINHIFMGVDIPVIQDYLKKNKKEMKEYTVGISPYFDLIHSTRELNYTKRNTDAFAWYFSHGELIGKGKALNGGDKLVGPWEFYYSAGNIKSKGAYNEKGNKEGPWIFYYFTGGVKGKEFYRDGKQEGEETYYSSNGLVSHHCWYKEDALDGEYISYFLEGNPHIVDHYVAGKEDGEKVMHYGSGNIGTRYLFKNGQEQGETRVWLPDGVLDYTCTYKDGKLDGPYKKYYENGQLATDGMYSKGAVDGHWKNYHENGQLKSEENLVDGKLDGPYKEFFDNGQVYNICSYIKGKVNGQQQLFDDDGKLASEFSFDKDKMLTARYLDKSGQTVGQFVNKGKQMDLTIYSAMGIKQATLTYNENSNANGTKTYFFASGTVSQTEEYLDGVLNGLTVAYFPNGNRRSVINYDNGQKNGYMKTYYPHGQLKEEGWYVNNKAEGYWMEYDELGALTDSMYFSGDDLNGYRSQYLPNGKKEFVQKYHFGTLMGMEQFDSTGKEINHFLLPAGSGRYSILHADGSVNMNATYTRGNMDGQRISYYFNGKMTTEAYFKNGLQDSVSRTWGPGGKIAFEGWYNLGNKKGTWKYYDSDGKLMHSIVYKGGKQNGMDTWYFPDGNTDEETSFKDDEKNGSDKRYDPDGTLMFQLNFKSGLLISYTYLDKDGHLLNPIPVIAQSAKIKAFFPNGTVSAELEYKDDYMTGAYILNFTNGKLRSISTRQYDNVEGAYKRYYPNGQLKNDFTYLHDNLHGSEKEYNTNGICIKESNFYNGSPHGLTKKYDDKGTLLETDLYYYGNLLSIKK